MGELSQRLNQTEETVLQVEDLDSTARTKLDFVTSDTQKLERTVQELLDQVEFMKNSDIRGENHIRCPLWAGFISGCYVPSSLDLNHAFSLFQGRQTASQSTSCSPRLPKLMQMPPLLTPAAQ